MCWCTPSIRTPQCRAPNCRPPEKRMEPSASEGIGRWLSAALSDENVCVEMKQDIEAWFRAGEPGWTPPPLS